MLLCYAWLGGLEAWLCFMHKWCIQACIKAFVLLVHIGVHKALFCLCKWRIGYMHGLAFEAYRLGGIGYVCSQCTAWLCLYAMLCYASGVSGAYRRA